MQLSRDEARETAWQALCQGQERCLRQELLIERLRAKRLDTTQAEAMLAIMMDFVQVTHETLQTLEGNR